MKNISQKPEIRSQKPDYQNTEDRSQKPEARHEKHKKIKSLSSVLCNLFSVICVLFSVFCVLSSVSADEISARAAVVMDGASEKILYAKNPHLRLPPASTTKLITAMVVLDKISPDAVITISDNAANTPSVTPHLKKGEKYTVKDLLYFALMRSVNGATVALAEAVAGSEEKFADMMNNKIIHLGLENTKFINASGLPGPDQYITAFDLSIIMKESLRYPLIKEILNTRAKEIYTLGGREIFIKNTNNLLWMNEDILGGKTGYTRAAGHCFVCAENKGNNMLIAVVLGETTRDRLWENSTLLLSKGSDVLNQKAEPMIYFSSVEKRPVVFASYKSNKSKRTYISKKQKNNNAKIAKKTGIKTKIAKKKVKKSSKNISAYRQRSANKS